MNVCVRSAKIEDVEALSVLVNEFAGRNEILPRSAEAIRASIDDWLVAAEEDQVLGCGSLRRYSDDLCEVRSLIVDQKWAGKGIGGQIVKDLIRAAEEKNCETVFALTRVVPFFEKMGFEDCPKDVFPEKIWADCSHCPSQDECDEHAVIFRIKPKAEQQETGIPIKLNGENHARIAG